MILVVDASVIVKWHVDEPDFQIARQLLLDTRYSLVAPGHAFGEIGSALAAYVRRGIVKRDNVRTIGENIVRTLQTRAVDVLIPAAVDIALDVGVTVYDAFYVALAADAPLATADKRLVAAASRSPHGHRVRHFAELVQQ
jgi:predicted nucleic acid-binding protein